MTAETTFHGSGLGIGILLLYLTHQYLMLYQAFAIELFNYWGIGKHGENNGVLIVISKGDRQVEIETGIGMTAILPDTKVQNIIDTYFLPQFEQKNFDRGILAGTRVLIVSIDPSLVPSLNRSQDADLPWSS